MHACGVARALGVPWLVAPPAAGVLSAIGFLTAPLAFDFVRSVRARIEDLAWADVDARFAEMEAEGLTLLAASGVAEGDVAHRRFADLRHEGQGYEIRVPVAASADDFPASHPGRVRRGVPGAVRAARPACARRGRQLARRLDRPATRVRPLAHARGGGGSDAEGPPPRLVPRAARVRRDRRARPLRDAPPACPSTGPRSSRSASRPSSSRRARAAPSRPTEASSWSSPHDRTDPVHDPGAVEPDRVDPERAADGADPHRLLDGRARERGSRVRRLQPGRPDDRPVADGHARARQLDGDRRQALRRRVPARDASSRATC